MTQRIVVGLLVAVILVLVVLFQPGLVRFWPFSAGEFVQLITPLFLTALFIERTLEVFVTSWRGAGATKAEVTVTLAQERQKAGAVAAAEDVAEARKAQADYKGVTQRIAFTGGVVLGVIVSAVGIRALQLFVDPAVFAALPAAQRTVFTAADVLLTGAVMGGGAEALHKLVSVFTNFMDSTANLAKARGSGS